jgi:flavorubredoxin
MLHHKNTTKGSYFLLNMNLLRGFLMPKVLVLYYSRTGNTEKMANAVAEGARAVSNIEVDIEYHVNAEDLAGYDAVLVGTSTYYHDMPMDMKSLFEEAAVKGINLRGKTGAAFGSYGWSGEAPKMVLEIMKLKFGMNTTEPVLTVLDTPNENSLNLCRALGKRVSETLMHVT